jgi:hypothetical protein
MEGRDQEDRGSRPARTNSSQDPISKITRANFSRGVAQEVESLLCKCAVLNKNGALYTTEYYSAIKKKEIMSIAGK